MARMHNPPHPGELIKASINELGITVTAFAEHIGVSRVALSRVLNGRASVTAILDYRVAAAFGQTPGLWLRMQTAYDLWKLEHTRLPKIERLAAQALVRTGSTLAECEAFIAPPGSKIISADYSQIELRIMAHLSGDKSLIDAFAKGEDIHRHIAGDIFNVPQNEVTSEQRRYAKVINFGLIHGMSAFGPAGNLGIERGYVETVFGRSLQLPDIRSANLVS